MLQQIQISEGYKPYSQHAILSVLLMVGYATGIIFPFFLGYLIYYSFRVAKIAGWKNYWRIDWMLPVGWTWSLALFIGDLYVNSSVPEDLQTRIVVFEQSTFLAFVAMLFLLLVFAIYAWGLAIIILAIKRGALDHFAVLAGPAKSSFIATSEIKRLFAHDTESKLQARK